jgi:lipoprotein NlpI
MVCEGNYDSAFSEARYAMSSARNDPGALFLLGVVQERQDDPDLARSTFDRLLSIDPEYNARGERAIAEYDVGDLGAARTDFDAAKLRADAKGNARLWLWIIDTKRGHADQANRDLTAWADGADSSGLEERKLLAEMILGRKTTQDLETFSASIKSPVRRQDYEGEIWFFAAEAALAKGDHATAEADFQKTLDGKATRIDEFTEAQREWKRLDSPLQPATPASNWSPPATAATRAPTATLALKPFDLETKNPLKTKVDTNYPAGSPAP